jgi:hypothetical protein
VCFRPFTGLQKLTVAINGIELTHLSTFRTRTNRHFLMEDITAHGMIFFPTPLLEVEYTHHVEWDSFMRQHRYDGMWHSLFKYLTIIEEGVGQVKADVKRFQRVGQEYTVHLYWEDLESECDFLDLRQNGERMSRMIVRTVWVDGLRGVPNQADRL